MLLPANADEAEIEGRFSILERIGDVDECVAARFEVAGLLILVVVVLVVVVLTASSSSSSSPVCAGVEAVVSSASCSVGSGGMGVPTSYLLFDPRKRTTWVSVFCGEHPTLI